MTTSDTTISIPKNQIPSPFQVLNAITADCGFDWLSPSRQPSAIFKPTLTEVCGSSRGACLDCQKGNCCGRCWCCYAPWPKTADPAKVAERVGKSPEFATLKAAPVSAEALRDYCAKIMAVKK